MAQVIGDALQQQRSHAPQPWEESARRRLRLEDPQAARAAAGLRSKGEPPPPYPALSLTASVSLNGIYSRQQLPPTVLVTSSNHLSLTSCQTPSQAPPLIMHPWTPDWMEKRNTAVHRPFHTPSIERKSLSN